MQAFREDRLNRRASGLAAVQASAKRKAGSQAQDSDSAAAGSGASSGTGAGTSSQASGGGDDVCIVEDDEAQPVDNKRRYAKNSPVWAYFHPKQAVEKGRGHFKYVAECKLCGAKISASNTTNLKAHLNGKHKDTMVTDKVTQEKVCPGSSVMAIAYEPARVDLACQCWRVHSISHGLASMAGVHRCSWLPAQGGWRCCPEQVQWRAQEATGLWVREVVCQVMPAYQHGRGGQGVQDVGPGMGIPLLHPCHLAMGCLFGRVWCMIPTPQMLVPWMLSCAGNHQWEVYTTMQEGGDGMPRRPGGC